MHIWRDNAATRDDVNEEEFIDKVIPGWIDTAVMWQEELANNGLEDVNICIEYVANNEKDLFFEINGGELTYSIFD